MELLGLRVESVSKVENGGDLIVVLICISERLKQVLSLSQFILLTKS